MGAWVAQFIEHLTSARVVILWFVGSSPPSGSLLLVGSPLQIFCSPPPLPPTATSKINLKKKKKVLQRGKITPKVYQPNPTEEPVSTGFIGNPHFLDSVLACYGHSSSYWDEKVIRNHCRVLTGKDTFHKN